MERTKPPKRLHAVTSLLGLVLLGLCCLSCSGSDTMRESQSRVPASLPQYQAPVIQSNTPIAIGDSISFSVWGYPEFTTRSLVKPPGIIIIPVVGEFAVAGYNKEEFTRQLRQKLGEFIQGDLKIAVEINNPVPRITVLGTVSHQGSFPTNIEMTLLEVLSLSGGWTEFSDLRYIKISRQATTASDRSFIEVDLTQYLESGNVRGIPLVRPGDVVFVPKKENFVREFSELLRDAFILFGFFNLVK